MITYLTFKTLAPQNRMANPAMGRNLSAIASGYFFSRYPVSHRKTLDRLPCEDWSHRYDVLVNGQAYFLGPFRGFAPDS